MDRSERRARRRGKRATTDGGATCGDAIFVAGDRPTSRPRLSSRRARGSTSPSAARSTLSPPPRSSTGDGVAAYAAARALYQSGQYPTGDIPFDITFDDVKFGYWGSAQSLASVLANPMGYGDEKTQKAISARDRDVARHSLAVARRAGPRAAARSPGRLARGRRLAGPRARARAPQPRVRARRLRHAARSPSRSFATGVAQQARNDTRPTRRRSTTCRTRRADSRRSLRRGHRRLVHELERLHRLRRWTRSRPTRTRRRCRRPTRSSRGTRGSSLRRTRRAAPRASRSSRRPIAASIEQIRAGNSSVGELVR